MELATTRGRFEVLDRGAGTPVVLVHGFPFAAESWEGEVGALASRMRLLAPSMRGFGGTRAAAMESLSIDAMADDVAAILDASGLSEPVVLGGLSMGGYVALAFARKYPRRLRGLVLADTRAEPDEEDARANRDRAIARIERGDLEGFVADLLPAILAAETRTGKPEVARSVRAMAMRAQGSSVISMLRALRDRPDARPGLGAIEVPVQIIVGAEDALTPPSSSRAMADGMAAGVASVAMIPHAGHLSNLEAPEAFREVLAAFVVHV